MQKCPVCSVVIREDIVYFSNSIPGTRGRLHARVCQYAKHPDCINQDPTKFVITEDDYYRPI